MKKLVSHKGFTLIELLVVIAIIAILSGTILVSLNSARSKAKDARVQAEMQQLKSQMELFYSSSATGGYGTATSCATGAFADITTDGASKLITAIQADANGGGTSVSCGSNGTAWAAAAKLNSGNFWCVDSTGTSRVAGTTQPAQGFTVCP